MNDQQKKQAIFIMVIGILAIIVVAVSIYVFKKRQEASRQVEKAPVMADDPLYQQAVQNLADKDYLVDLEMEKNRPWNEEDLKKLGMVFAERLGSFSSHSNYQNILDLKIYMSPEMISWADSYVANLGQERDKSNEYYLVSSQAVSAKISDFVRETSAKGEITTLRNEDRNGQKSTFSQVLRVEFKKIEEQWKISDASWVK